ncbi:MAG: DNA methyltransferase [Acidimicrobiales bacterium]
MASDPNSVEILSRAECLSLLAGRPVGRVALTAKRLPTILPVRYGLSGQDVVFAAGIGSPSVAAAHESVIAFEADGGDVADGSGWTVLALGVSRRVDERDADWQTISALGLHRCGDRHAAPVMRVATDRLCGRRLDERLGYPTQKPLALLERIIAASSNEGDVVLDPFCGCGTTIDAAQKLGRRWVGIDITYLAVDLIRKRLRHTYGPDIEGTYRVRGIPTDVEGALELFRDNPFDFERWAVSLVNAQPNQKQVGDRGVDGRVRFHAGKNLLGTLLVSVKGGRQLNPAMVRDLAGTVGQERADMGLLIVLDEPTRGMRDVTGRSGTYVNPFNGNEYPKLQIVTVPQLLAGTKPKMPEAILPYVQAKARGGGDQLSWDVT